MGFFKINKITDNEHNIYIYFITNKACSEVLIKALDFQDNSYTAVVDCASEAVEKWAKIHKQTPEAYVAQLCHALASQSENGDLERSITNSKNNESKNIFEIDGENLIWRQYFESKNIYGRWGKFPMEKRDKDEILGDIFDAVIKELHEKEASISRLEKENKLLLKEKDELKKVAEDCVSMKESFEREIFGKLVILLNSKKQKNSELRAQIQESNLQGDSSSNDDQDNETYESVPKTVSLSKLLDDFESNKPMKINSDLDVASTTYVQPKLKRKTEVTTPTRAENSSKKSKFANDSDDDDYDGDTDVEDFHNEVEVINDNASSTTDLKRKGSGSATDSEVKKPKGKHDDLLLAAFLFSRSSL
ncbi:DNA repair protein XRCC4 [Armadillidium nasatum]|uniref:DNA repair protein XRCC4 n=1 Tax=Armadillidium nasatum TaxID=96803 RepID=A0A5N5SNR4_9CRUS|nr:DNA repair protein XRCC4 [Armadillidium nasatum]